jgi:hypothetical protein
VPSFAPQPAALPGREREEEGEEEEEEEEEDGPVGEDEEEEDEEKAAERSCTPLCFRSLCWRSIVADVPIE